MKPGRLEVAYVRMVPWKWDVSVLRGGTEEAITAFVRSQGIDSDASGYGQALGHTWVSKGHPAVIWLHSLKDHATLAHEAMHVTFQRLESRGMKCCFESEEAYTYTLENLIRQIQHAKWSSVR